MNTLIYLADITGFNLTTGLTEVLRLSDAPYMTQRTDTPPDMPYIRCIKQAANLALSAYLPGATSGASSAGYGEMQLLNKDGKLDYLTGYAFSGQPITIWCGQPGASYPSGFTPILMGRIDLVEFDLPIITIRLRDKQTDLDQPLLLTKYLGNNALPAGVEGVATDLKDKLKPWGVGGQAQNMPWPCVNTSLYIYQVSDAAVYSVDGVYDRQVPLTAGAAYPDMTTMISTAPAAAGYRVLITSGGTYVRVGSKPNGTITGDATFDAPGSRTAAQAWQKILLRAGVASGDISAADVAALDALNAADVQLWFAAGDSSKFKDAADQLAGTVGAYWYPDALGKWRIKRFDLPTGIAAATLRARDITSIKRIASNDIDKGIPTWRVTINYGRNYSPQSSDFDVNTTEARKAFVRDEYRQAVAEDGTVKNTWSNAQELVLTSCFVLQAPALAEATRQLNLRKVPRELWEIKSRPPQATLAAIALGTEVSATYPRYTLTNGRVLRAIGIEPNARLAELTLKLWG